MGAHAIAIKISEKSFIATNILQRVFLSWLSRLKGKEIPIHTINFILMHANFVNVKTFPLIQAIFDDPYPFLRYLTKVVISQNMDTTVLAKNFSWRNSDTKNPIMYIMRKVGSSEQKFMLFIYEISMVSHVKHRKFGRVRCWSFISCNRNSLVRKEGRPQTPIECGVLQVLPPSVDSVCKVSRW